MNKSQRIYLSTGDTGNQNQDKFIKVKLDQNVETLEFMSLSIGTADAYQNFNADYGVLVGRVIANNGIGIPNVKISIFIPLTNEDAENSDIYSIYPYKTPRDENNEGKRYNLLPRVAEKDPNTGIITPKQPFGSFPIKEEIVGNPLFLDVYKKYYKYTALTNGAGDYMIFGVPIGTQIIHMSLDITDIGKYSMTPASMVNNLGYSPNLFYDNNTKIKPSNDLLDLPNIETQEITVEVVPFWGDVENFEIGITRQDFRVRAELLNTFIIFGSVFTDNADAIWADKFDDDRTFGNYYRISDNGDGEGANISIAGKRYGKVTESIYYYPNQYSDTDIDNKLYGPDEMKLLNKSEYTTYNNNGDFVFIINSNRNKIITGEDGQDVPVSDGYNGGVYTSFRGFVVFEITRDELDYSFTRRNLYGDRHAYPFRYKLKFPQKSQFSTTLGSESFTKKDDTSERGLKTDAWRREDYNFKAGEIYSVARFHGLVYNSNPEERINWNYTSSGSRFGTWDDKNDLNKDPYWNTGVIGVDNSFDDNNSETEFPHNGVTNANKKAFGANWLNLTIHFPQVGWMANTSAWDEISGDDDPIGSTSSFSRDNDSKHFFKNNEQQIAGKHVNTKHFARSDLHHTDFIKMNKFTIKLMNGVDTKGFTATSVGDTLESQIRNGDYRNGETSTNTYGGGRINGNSDLSTNDTNYYFYKGQNDSDCIKYLISLGLV